MSAVREAFTRPRCPECGRETRGFLRQGDLAPVFECLTPCSEEAVTTGSIDDWALQLVCLYDELNELSHTAAVAFRLMLRRYLARRVAELAAERDEEKRG